MLLKPFRPPSFLSRPAATPVTNNVQDGEPPMKKRRLSPDQDSGFQLPTSQPSAAPQSTVSKLRAPLVVVKNSPASTLLPFAEAGHRTVFSALWRKITNKKHKTWDGDGTVIVTDGYASLKNDKGKYMGRTPCRDSLEPGSALSIGGMNVEIEGLLSSEELAAVKKIDAGDGPILSGSSQLNQSQTMKSPAAQFRPPQQPTVERREATAKAQLNPHIKLGSGLEKSQVAAAKVMPYKPLMPSQRPASLDANRPAPKHDPDAEGALVMQRPSPVTPGQQIVDVVVDPVLCKRLREHQRAGVAFMYECVMGLRCKEGAGAILADEMGLGKTLQTIALLWTLLKQNPIPGQGPVVRKAIIICPAGITRNWKKEFRKWLGNERVGVLVAEDQRKISRFTRGKSYQVLVVGYEMFNLVQADLQKCDEIDLIVADEGHRLKKAKNKTVAAINTLDCEKRVVLTGTLLQNDYSEWFSVVDFVNPGFLGKYSSFRKTFENPILRSRQQGASLEDVEKGAEADRELKAQTGSFILRRTADILSKYLPPKTEYVVLCRPTSTQVDVYNALLNSGTLSAAIRSPEMSFQLISMLKKACNSPSLLVAKADKGGEGNILPELVASFPRNILTKTNASGKTRVLDDLLHQISSTTDEKVVIMSNYTSTLDLIARMLDGCDYSYLRLDGSTPAGKRQDLVDTFNRSPAKKHFAFLMSTKAGGVGLNLIGASRLILFDIDWNPALDQQAMARTHRDGQKRPCFIYRLITKGALEERIFQRQVSKTDLAGQVVDDKVGTSSFTADELRDLFTLDVGEGCRTHEIIGCRCGSGGEASEGGGNGAVTEADGDEDELEDEVVKGRDFVTASQYERRSRSASPGKSSGKKGLAGLMLYEHIDTRKYRASLVEDGAEMTEEERKDSEDDDDDDELGKKAKKEVVADEVLRRVVVENGSAVDFLFVKKSEDVVVGDGGGAVVADEASARAS